MKLKTKKSIIIALSISGSGIYIYTHGLKYLLNTHHITDIKSDLWVLINFSQSSFSSVKFPVL